VAYAGAPNKPPIHLGLILDGNRRWARSEGMPQLEGHRLGYKNLHPIAVHAVNRGVKVISAYVFSTENWNRTQEEVAYLMDLVVWVSKHEVKKYLKDGLRIVFLGSRVRLSDKVVEAIESVEEQTKDNTRGIVALCMNYGGHTELAEGVARMIADGVEPGEVNVDKLAEYLYHPELPSVDLIIRTSGEQRISNFMLWRAAYAELYFTNVPWPAFTTADLDLAFDEYASRQRRLGK